MTMGGTGLIGKEAANRKSDYVGKRGVDTWSDDWGCVRFPQLRDTGTSNVWETKL